MSNGQSKSSAMVSSHSQEQLQKYLVGLMAEGLVRFKNSQPTEVEQRLYLVDWLEMVRDYGASRFTRALRLAYRKGNFFPQPADIEKWIEPLAEPNVSTYEPPTEEQKAMRGTEEQKLLWRDIMARVNGMARQKQLSPQDANRPYTPTPQELAAEMSDNPLAEALGWKRKEGA